MRTILTSGLLLTLALLPMGCEEKVCFNAKIVNVPAGPWIQGKDMWTTFTGVNDFDVAVGQVWRHDGADGLLYDLNDDTYEFFSPVGASHVFAGDINNQGTVAFAAVERTGEMKGRNVTVAYLRTIDGHLDRLPSPTRGLAPIIVDGLNDVGDAVGSFWDADELRWRGVIWTDGAFEVYDAPDAVDTWVKDIADDGTLVGAYTEGGDEMWGFLDNGEFVPVSYDGRRMTMLEGINDAGAAAGWGADVTEWSWLDLGTDVDAVRAPPPGAARGFLLHGDRMDRIWMRGSPTWALGVNNANVVVGTTDWGEMGLVATPKQCPER